jgi:hypothetical protein
MTSFTPNSLVAKIPFSYRGELLEPSARINLDAWMEQGAQSLPDFVQIVARENHIGPYSYELEVMEVSDVLFDSPCGLANDFYNPDTQEFDFAGFAEQWLAERHFEQLTQITQACLDTQLEPGSALHKALMAAFALGRNSV